MKTRPYVSSDYPVLSSWWEAHKWPAVPERCLPKTGLVVDGLAAGFLYHTDSSIFWLEWLISNPASDKIERNQALTLLIENLLKAAREAGASFVFTSVQHAGLIERYKQHGFAVTETGMTNMVRGL